MCVCVRARACVRASGERVCVRRRVHMRMVARTHVCMRPTYMCARASLRLCGWCRTTASCMCVYTCVGVDVRVSACMRACVCVRALARTCGCACASTSACAHMCACVHACACAYMRVHMRMHMRGAFARQPVSPFICACVRACQLPKPKSHHWPSNNKTKCPETKNVVIANMPCAPNSKAPPAFNGL